MNKISFYNVFYKKNDCFEINNSDLNRANCNNSFGVLKNKFSANSFDLSTSDINLIKDSEIIIYMDMPEKLPKEKDIHKSYLLIMESKLIQPDNWSLEKHKYFTKIFTWDDELIDNKKYFKINYTYLFPYSIPKYLIKKENFCTLIAGNKYVNHPLELYSKRVEAIRWFEKNHIEEFDLYGVGWDEYLVTNRYIRFALRKLKLTKLTKLTKILKLNYPSYKGKVASKKDTLEKYKFYICYENAKNIDGYITEKIFECFFAGCVPIYWGAGNVLEYIPKECFIDKRKFDNYEELYLYMKNMTDDRYIEYLNAIEEYLKSNQSKQFTAECFANTILDHVKKDMI